MYNFTLPCEKRMSKIYSTMIHCSFLGSFWSGIHRWHTGGSRPNCKTVVPEIPLVASHKIILHVFLLKPSFLVLHLEGLWSLYQLKLLPEKAAFGWINIHLCAKCNEHCLAHFYILELLSPSQFFNFEHRTIIKEVMVIWSCPCLTDPLELPLTNLRKI